MNKTNKNTEQTKSFSRRDFIGTVSKGAGCAALASMLPISLSAQTKSAQRMGPSPRKAKALPFVTRWEIEAVPTDEIFANGGIVPFARLQALPGYPSQGTLAFIVGTEGSKHALVLHNHLSTTLQLEIPGVATGPEVLPGKSKSLIFDMPSAGTYLLTEKKLGITAGPIGLGALIVSHPTSGLKELWKGGPTYDQEYMLLYHDTDDRWNQDFFNGQTPNLNLFEPNYFTVNGLSYPDVGSHPDTLIKCQVGDRVLLRFGNIGKVRQAIHFHGYHAEIAARNNVPETSLPEKDTIEVASSSTVDVILPVTQPGIFPLHPHFVPAVTANGLYPYGQLALIEAI